MLQVHSMVVCTENMSATNAWSFSLRCKTLHSAIGALSPKHEMISDTPLFWNSSFHFVTLTVAVREEFVQFRSSVHWEKNQTLIQKTVHTIFKLGKVILDLFLTLRSTSWPSAITLCSTSVNVSTQTSVSSLTELCIIACHHECR